ncbi:TonB-dependent outer membrane porin [Psychroflexus torquis ATCC 700755]|uniref:TonB-dependent outer membrane porin n=1 Tax=Psychroflexus torquis (strain ATCC 700755 / CIP 106069 / ACAM 623) TaxID=313595 RepID=K4IUR7_PSYTT|nr:porin family protein [Psychroflexus torquis]AFU69220.1 TonB-dependent outer membrane porin [Psychroflexus torquis ATCC 700755]
MKFIGFLSLLLSVSSLFAQDKLEWLKENKNDSLYREDQFYFGFSFNFLTELPSGVDQSGFSGGLMFGYIRDMPINKRRNLSIGLGLGFNLNTFGQSLQVNSNAGQDIFLPINQDQNYDVNWFTTNLVEVPLELRWRSSDIDKYAFWRVYLGFQVGYVFRFKSTFKSVEEQYTVTDVNALNSFRTSAKLTFGYGAINFFVNMSLIPVFEGEVESTGERVSITPIKAGLVFFFL